MEPNFRATQWIGWIASAIAAAVAFTAFAFTTFETKEEATKREDRIEVWLDRVEGKVDRLLTRGKQ